MLTKCILKDNHSQSYKYLDGYPPIAKEKCAHTFSLAVFKNYSEYTWSEGIATKGVNYRIVSSRLSQLHLFE